MQSNITILAVYETSSRAYLSLGKVKYMYSKQVQFDNVEIFKRL